MLRIISLALFAAVALSDALDCIHYCYGASGNPSTTCIRTCYYAMLKVAQESSAPCVASCTERQDQCYARSHHDDDECEYQFRSCSAKCLSHPQKQIPQVK